MIKQVLLISGILFASCVHSQVGINNSNPKSTLDITAKNTNGTTAEGIIAPRLTGDQVKAADLLYGSDQKGAVVYVTAAVGVVSTKTVNITSEGYYFFDGNIWQKLGSTGGGTTISVTTLVDSNILGYIPSTTSTAATSAPASMTIGTTTATRQGITTYGGHSYAAYSTTGPITWYDAYNTAKGMGGYLAVFTTDGEWQHVETQLLTSNVIFNNHGGWIGMCKFSWYAGGAMTPDPEFKWITGELPYHDYGDGGVASVRKINWFFSGEPNGGSFGGFIHFFSADSANTLTRNGYTSTHTWNDHISNAGSNQVSWGFIVEFQQ